MKGGKHIFFYLFILPKAVFDRYTLFDKGNQRS